jgi:hypothetical protein
MRRQRRRWFSEGLVLGGFGEGLFLFYGDVAKLS